jgi:hypothetical protein
MIAAYQSSDLWVLFWIIGAVFIYFPLEGLRRRLVRRWDHRKVSR